MTMRIGIPTNSWFSHLLAPSWSFLLPSKFAMCPNQLPPSFSAGFSHLHNWSKASIPLLSHSVDDLLPTSQRKPMPRAKFLPCKLPTYLQTKGPCFLPHPHLSKRGILPPHWRVPCVLGFFAPYRWSFSIFTSISLSSFQKFLSLYQLKKQKQKTTSLDFMPPSTFISSQTSVLKKTVYTPFSSPLPTQARPLALVLKSCAKIINYFFITQFNSFHLYLAWHLFNDWRYYLLVEILLL